MILPEDVEEQGLLDKCINPFPGWGETNHDSDAEDVVYEARPPPAFHISQPTLVSSGASFEANLNKAHTIVCKDTFEYYMKSGEERKPAMVRMLESVIKLYERNATLHFSETFLNRFYKLFSVAKVPLRL